MVVISCADDTTESGKRLCDSLPDIRREPNSPTSAIPKPWPQQKHSRPSAEGRLLERHERVASQHETAGPGVIEAEHDGNIDLPFYTLRASDGSSGAFPILRVE